MVRFVMTARQWFLLLLLLAFLAPLARAADKGSVLVVYKGSEFKTAAATPVKAHLEAVLKKLGYGVAYHDVDRSLPSAQEMQKYTAVLSWHQTARYARPQEYVRWLRDQVMAGRKVIVLGNFGAHTTDEKTWLTNEELNEFFMPFGLNYAAAYTGAAEQLQVVSQNQKIVKGAVKPTYYLLFRSHDARNQGDLVVRRKDMPDSDSYLVVRTPHGAMAGESYIWKDNALRVDASAFLSSALAPAAVSDRLTPGGRLLGLFKGSEGTSADNNEIKLFLAAPLKELGYTVDYRNLEDGLPSEADMKQYVGIITWYRSPATRNAAAYANWLTDQIVAGRKVVVFGNYGAFQEQLNDGLDRWLLSEEYNNFFYPFGLEFKGTWTNDASKITEQGRDPAMVPWLEKAHLNHYFLFRPASPEDKVFLRLGRTDLPEGESAVVVRTPYGGLALENYIVRFDGKQNQFHIDLKRFLEETLTYRPQKLPEKRSLAVTPTQVGAAPPAALPQPPPLPAEVTELKRRVLCFYQRSNRETSVVNALHQQGETVLNYLGLVVDYRAIEDGLPGDAEMEPYRGILTWWSGSSLPDAQAYNEWLLRQIQAGRKVVLMGGIGSTADSTLKGQADPGPALAALGFKLTPSATQSAVRAGNSELGLPARTGEITFMDPKVCNYERSLTQNNEDLRKLDWPILKLEDPAGKTYLRVKDPRGESDVVAVSSRGGVAMGNFPCYAPIAQPLRSESLPPDANASQYAAAERSQATTWQIDPFIFFAAAFQTDELPKPDLSTLNGSRLFWAHVDGDAAGGMSHIDRSTLNSEMLYREIFTKYSLPFTVSYISDDMLKRAKPYYARDLDAARRIQSLPNVDTASHTTAHPFDWVKGDNFLTPDRKLARQPPSIPGEITAAVDFTNQLITPREKPTRLLLWTGLCNPTPEAVALTDALGIANMNGGNPIYDSNLPYIAGVYPVYSDVGEGRIQYHTAAAGDFYYTHSWTRNFDGMKELVDYYQKTEKPYRLRPMNAYFHFYLAEKQPGLDGLKAAFDYVLKQDFAPIFAADYVPIVKDFITMRYGRAVDGSLVVHNQGPLRTIRLDGVKQAVDLNRSQGVIGFVVEGNSLYVHLEEGSKHRIFLQDPAPSKTYLVKGSHYIDGWRLTNQGVSFRFQGTGPAFFTLANLAPNASYRVSVGGLGSQTLKSDAQGRLTWRGTLTAFRGTYPVEVSR
ncbi:MAG: hypothetical protein AMXMBFR33_12660 [Candidatus Xenobia bacterium]